MRDREKLVKGALKLFCILDLLLWVLLLQYAIEAGHDIPVNLHDVVSHNLRTNCRGLLTWSAQSLQWARIFASSGRSAVPSFKSSS
jgi:hypothetical protein